MRLINYEEKNIVLSLTVMLCILLSACGEKIDSSAATSANTDKSIAIEEVTEEDTSEEISEYPSEEAEYVEFESDKGYSIMYNPDVITLDDTGEGDLFSYNTDEKLDAPVYISVIRYDDMDSQALTDGLILQSGIDGLKAENTYFGADSIETQCIYIENDVDGITQMQIFYVIPLSEGSMLIEIGGYIGAPTNVDTAINEMLGTFSLK